MYIKTKHFVHSDILRAKQMKHASYCYTFFLCFLLKNTNQFTLLVLLTG